VHATAPGDAPTERQRIRTVDALRGLAALAVVFYHVQAALNRGEQAWIPAAWRGFAGAGHFGVNVFFVLSGFVIARSVREGSMTLGYFGRFALRRSIRLDPPYWSAIALELAAIYLGLLAFPSLATALPSKAQLLAHLVYLQDILGYGHLIPIFWTLCYEFQFYLTFVGVLVIGHFLADRFGRRAGTLCLGILFGALFLASVGAHHGWLGHLPRGVAIDRWYEFFTGVLAWWVVAGVVRLPALGAAWLANGLLARHPDSLIEIVLITSVSTLCLLGAIRPALDQRFASRPLQFLGAISYSLYLYHATVGWRIVSLAQHFWGMSLPPLVGLVTWLSAVAAAIVAGYVGWRLLERPSLNLAKRVSLPHRCDESGSIAVLSAPEAPAPL
jgi:peptidoglycan/LPS O-acetylase OafA/YrhL